MTKFKALHGSCVNLLPKLGLKFDFIFADPPFNIGHPYKGFDDNIPWGEYILWTGSWLQACHDAMKESCVIALHGPDSVAKLYIENEKHFGWKQIAWVQWHYRFGQNQSVATSKTWNDSRCHCLIYCKTEKYTWNPESVLVPSDRAAVYNDKRTAQSLTPGLRLPGSVWGVPSDGPFWGRVPGNSKERREGHPNQLPEVYLERLIRAYTNEGDLVLDPFCGSGTTATVGVALGRRCVTMDISESSVESARKRIKEGPVRLSSS